MKIACYPGSFDPITNGHVEIVNRALKLFDKVIIIVANNIEKRYYFSLDERVKIVKEVFKDYENVEVVEGKGLSSIQAKNLGAHAVIRGLRAVSDYEYECQFAETNEYLVPDMEMVFLMSHKQYSFISSTHIKEIYALDGDISPLVPDVVLRALDMKKAGN